MHDKEPARIHRLLLHDGRVVSEQSLNGGTKTMQYDAAGRRTRLTWADGFFVNYDHLVTGEMKSIVENGSVTLIAFDYDNLGRRTWLHRANGTNVQYDYDAASRLHVMAHNLGGTSADLQNYIYYNPAGQIISQSKTVDAFAWTGHGSGTTASTANGLNQLVTNGAAAMQHDARGNMTSDGSRTFGYNLKNQLAAKDGSTQLYYEPTGRLTQQWNGGGTLDWVGDEIVSENGGSNARRYVHGPGVDEPLVWYEGPGTGGRRYLHADERGSIIAVTDNAGTPIAINRYDEYGVSASTNIGRFQYTGQAWLPEIGLYYYKNRMRDPRLDRFMQTDLIGYVGGINLYSYGKNDPINLKDASGTIPIAIPVVIAARCVGNVACRGAVAGAVRWGVRQVIGRSSSSIISQSQVNEDGPFAADSTGKITEADLNPSNIGDGELDNAITQLDRSIERRNIENGRHPRGNPNGSPNDKKNYSLFRKHKERIARETETRDRLVQRRARLDDEDITR